MKPLDWQNALGLNVAALMAALRRTDLMRPGRASFHLACECDRDARKHQYDADHGKRVAKTHHQRLMFHGIAERDNGLLTGCRRVRHTMCHEEVRHLRNPVADLLASERDRLADDIGMELLALGDD